VTDRRTYAFAQPALTSSEDRPAPACAGRPEAFDYLIDYRGGDGHGFALHQARELCGVQNDGTIRRDPAQRCPRVMDCLLRDNRDEGWARVVLGLPAVEKTRTGSASSDVMVERHKRRHDERLADLRELNRQGVGLDEALTRLGTSRDALYKWCLNHRHLDEWAALVPPREPAVVSRRRRVA